MPRASSILYLALFCAGTAQARDTVLNIPLEQVLELPEAKSKLDPGISLHLAGARTPKVLERLGGAVANKKTNGLGKTDDFGCKWVILSALIELQEQARRAGANAVIDIASYYKKVETRNESTIECHAGATVIGATLKASFAKLSR